MRIKAIILVFILIFVSNCSAFDLSSMNPQPGDNVVLTGTASPGEQVNLRSSFAMDLPVTNGQYEYETNVQIPQKPNRFAVTARNVKDMNVGVKMVIWITKRFEASGGTASISQSDVPPGRYDLKMFGAAADAASKVPVEVNAETSVKADPSGKYSLVIDTSGIPKGDYRIEGAGDSKIIHIGGSSGAPNAGVSSSSEGSGSNSGSEGAAIPPAQESSPGKEITPDIIQWYAGQQGLDSKNSGQYAKAESQLRNMLSGGYWKVIARGEPMTEKAGNCENEYCLVRGIGACTTCRAEDMLIKSNRQTAEANGTDENPVGANAKVLNNISGKASASGSENSSIGQPSGSIEEKKGFFNSIIDGIRGIIGG